MRTKEIVNLKCNFCGAKIIRSAVLHRNALKHGMGKNAYCNRSCFGKYSGQRQKYHLVDNKKYDAKIIAEARELRDKKHYSHQQIADSMHVPFGSVAYILSGCPKRKKVWRMSNKVRSITINKPFYGLCQHCGTKELTKHQSSFCSKKCFGKKIGRKNLTFFPRKYTEKFILDFQDVFILSGGKMTHAKLAEMHEKDKVPLGSVSYLLQI